LDSRELALFAGILVPKECPAIPFGAGTGPCGVNPGAITETKTVKSHASVLQRQKETEIVKLILSQIKKFIMIP